MAGTQEQMAQYTVILREHTQNQGIPVTEIIPFKLKLPSSSATTQEFEKQIFTHANKGKGISRAAWGYSLHDPHTLIWMMDWDKIEDHWAFWQTSDFLPVMAGINSLFVEGRPLVRHYRFEPRGMVQQEFVRVVIWNETERGTVEEVLKGKALGKGCEERKAGFAIDMQEESWFCTLLGYESEEKARADDTKVEGVEGVEGVENHVVKLKYVDTF